MKPIDQLVLDIALALCATGFLMVAIITGPGLGWMLFTVAVLLYAVLRVLAALHRLVPGGFRFAEGGIVPSRPSEQIELPSVSREKAAEICKAMRDARDANAVH